MASRLGSKIDDVIPGVADTVDPSTLGSAECRVVPDGDDPETSMVPCDAVVPADTPVIQHEVSPVIPDAVAPMCDGDPDDVAPKISCEDALNIPAPIIPVPAIPGDADPRSGRRLSISLRIFITRFSSSEIRNGSLSVHVKFTHVVGGVVLDAPVACLLSKVSSTLGLGLVLVVS